MSQRRKQNLDFKSDVNLFSIVYDSMNAFSSLHGRIDASKKT